MSICVIDMSIAELTSEVVKTFPEIELASNSFPLVASNDIMWVMDHFNRLYHDAKDNLERWF